MSIHKKNQHFGTLDLIMLVVLCGTVSSVIGASVAGLLHDNRPGRAKSSAEALALQIRQQREHSNQAFVLSSSRSPASASEHMVPPLTDGQIGKDPWGRPYFYSVLGEPTDQSPTIVVWSEGPDGRMETDISELSDKNPEAFRFKGDDVGFVSKSKF